MLAIPINTWYFLTVSWNRRKVDLQKSTFFVVRSYLHESCRMLMHLAAHAGAGR